MDTDVPLDDDHGWYSFGAGNAFTETYMAERCPLVGGFDPLTLTQTRTLPPTRERSGRQWSPRPGGVQCPLTYRGLSRVPARQGRMVA